MKRASWVILLLALGLGVSVHVVRAKIKGTILSEKAVAKKWGESRFDPKAFRTASMEDRAKMASSLLNKKSLYVGHPRGDVKQSLGEYSGFYFSEMYPTYLIQETSEKSSEAWQIVFLIDNAGIVTDIVVHKNCCE